ncbi:MAG: hypothetical protein IJK60_05455 [Clostridia bacterium]|nr:hypothetical protein [Clostridia bacterium]
MPEYTANAVQTVTAGNNVLFTETAVPCNRGYVIHREGAGVITLRGIVNNCCSQFARYKVCFGANIAIAEGGTVEPISLALAIDGEPIPTSSSIVTPAAVGDFWNVYDGIFVTVPRGCCYTIAVENNSEQPIDVQNANIIIERVA